ncbi:flagellar export chaperone FliS [Paenibacillus xylanilyticus]|uniref:flagellar export chaperone FliS n=1 Tax=Paenibacillus TaxID=44249 RepID=UPI0039A2E537
MINSAYQKYQQTQAQTASKPKLLIMLYDGAIRFVQAGIEGISELNYEKANNNLCKAQAIIHELISSLNFEYSISNDLVRIYEYMLDLLKKSNIQKQSLFAEEVVEHLRELREAWFGATKQVGAGFGV